MHLARLASLFFGRPHFVTPEAARAMLMALDGKLGGPIRIDNNGFVGDWQYDMTERGRRWKGYRAHNGIGILDMRGELVNRGTWLNADSGLISYDGLREQIRMLRQDDKVKAVVADVDCPGGEATGMSETAAEWRALAAEKPVIAVANAMMCSAAYGICSGSTRIVTARMGFVGSIGCVMMHADMSEHLAQEGVKVTLIHKGAHKVDGNPYEPLPESVRAEYDALAQRYYDDFVATVAAGRPSLSDKAIRATEARTYHGADAVKAGLADAVGTFESVLAELETQIAAQAATPKSPAASLPRSTASAGAKIMDKTHTQADVDAARADGAKVGAKAERERMGAIINSPEAQANAGLAAHCAFDSDMPAVDAIAALKAAGPAAKAAAPAPVVANAPPMLAGLELAAPAPAANAKPKAALDTASVYAARR